MKSSISLLIMLLCLICSHASAQQRGSNEKPPKQEYNEKFKDILNDVANRRALDGVSPLSPREMDELKQALRRNDLFTYAPSATLKPQDVTIKLDPSRPGTPLIKLGHTFITTLVFTDAAGNPWAVDTLSDVSDQGMVVSKKVTDNVITVQPKVRGGQANLPVILKGETRPITFLLEISDVDAYFTVDVQVDGLGNSEHSETLRAIKQYSNGEDVTPKLTTDPAKELMQQRITPDGYTQVRLFDEYRNPVDARDFMAWKKDGKLYLLTPHFSFTPDPIDISPVSDGRTKLMEFNFLPVISVRMNSKIFFLRVE